MLDCFYLKKKTHEGETKVGVWKQNKKPLEQAITIC